MKFFKVIISGLICVFTIELCEAISRKISNHPAVCGDNSSVITHIEALGENDSLHYLFTTWKIVSGLVARTDKNVTVHVNCSVFKNIEDMEKSISFSEEPLFYYGFSFNKLYEYNDADDNADLTKLKNDTKWTVTDFSTANISWQIGYNDSSHIMTFTVSQNATNLNFQHNGTLSFSFKIHSKDGEADQLPHLEYNANITQMHLKLDRLLPNYPNSRYALEIGLVSVDMNHSKVADDLLVHRRLDDEHTPGVFQMIDWQSSDTSKGAFMQWKPVCYTWDPHTITNSTQVHKYAVMNSTISPAFRLIHAYLGSQTSHFYMKMTNVSFGLTNDKFYAKNNYTSWSLNIGYGSPPEEKVSLLIILIISVGLGLPVLLIIGGSISMCVRRKKQQEGQFSSSYSQIQ